MSTRICGPRHPSHELKARPPRFLHRGGDRNQQHYTGNGSANGNSPSAFRRQVCGLFFNISSVRPQLQAERFFDSCQRGHVQVRFAGQCATDGGVRDPGAATQISVGDSLTVQFGLEPSGDVLGDDSAGRCVADKFAGRPGAGPEVVPWRVDRPGGHAVIVSVLATAPFSLTGRGDQLDSGAVPHHLPKGSYPCDRFTSEVSS